MKMANPTSQIVAVSQSARAIKIFDENVKQILYNWGDVHRLPAVR